MNTLDLIVILTYFAGIFCMAFLNTRKLESNSNVLSEQYLAGKSITTFQSICSIIATEVSALTFIGIPALAYSKDFQFVQIYFGAVIGRFIIAQVMLPKVYDKGLTIYEVIAHRFGVNNKSAQGQKVLALFYAINKFLAVGVRVFAGSILVSEFFAINVIFAVSIILVLTLLYTLIGGLKVVILTDMIQMSLFIFGGIVAHYYIPQVAGSDWSHMMQIAHSAGKTLIIDFNNLTPFIFGVAGGILFDMATHGVDQDFAQRLTANKSLKGAKIAIFFSSFISILVGLLFLSIGALLWSYHQDLGSMIASSDSDKVFASFITHSFPPGIRGLMLAGVIAATMSTLDSSINALSACFYNDIFQHKTRDIKEIKNFYFRDTLIICFIFFIVALIASNSSGLVLFGLKITSWTAGSLLAIFFGSLVFKWGEITPGLVTLGYILGIAGVYCNTVILKWNWNLNVYWGFVLSLGLYYTYSKLGNKLRPRNKV